MKVETTTCSYNTDFLLILQKVSINKTYNIKCYINYVSIIPNYQLPSTNNTSLQYMIISICKIKQKCHKNVGDRRFSLNSKLLLKLFEFPTLKVVPKLMVSHY